MAVFTDGKSLCVLGGVGDLCILVRTMRGQPFGEVQVIEIEPGEIGRDCGAELSPIPEADWKVPLRMMFTDLASLDVVIGGFQCLREHIAAHTPAEATDAVPAQPE